MFWHVADALRHQPPAWMFATAASLGRTVLVLESRGGVFSRLAAFYGELDTTGALRRRPPRGPGLPESIEALYTRPIDWAIGMVSVNPRSYSLLRYDPDTSHFDPWLFDESMLVGGGALDTTPPVDPVEQRLAQFGARWPDEKQTVILGSFLTREVWMDELLKYLDTELRVDAMSVRTPGFEHLFARSTHGSKQLYSTSQTLDADGFADMNGDEPEPTDDEPPSFDDEPEPPLPTLPPLPTQPPLIPTQPPLLPTQPPLLPTQPPLPTLTPPLPTPPPPPDPPQPLPPAPLQGSAEPLGLGALLVEFEAVVVHQKVSRKRAPASKTLPVDNPPAHSDPALGAGAPKPSAPSTAKKSAREPPLGGPSEPSAAKKARKAPGLTNSPPALPPAPPSAPPSGRVRRAPVHFGRQGELDGAGVYRSTPPRPSSRSATSLEDKSAVPSFVAPGACVWAKGWFAGCGEWFVARVVKVRPNFPCVHVTYLQDSAGNGGALCLPPMDAYLCATDLRKWVAAVEKVLRQALFDVARAWEGGLMGLRTGMCVCDLGHCGGEGRAESEW